MRSAETRLRTLLLAGAFALLALALWPLVDLLPEPSPQDPSRVAILPPKDGDPLWSTQGIDWSATREMLEVGRKMSSAVFADITPPRLAQVVSVSPIGGANRRKICDAACGDATSTCAAGSALASITDSSITKKYLVALAPGDYDECVVIDGKTDITLLGPSWQSVNIRKKNIIASSDVSGGALRIASNTLGRGATSRIAVLGVTVQNDGYSSPEAAIQIGKESGPGAGNPSNWQDVLVANVRTIGNHDSIQWFGSGLTTDLDLPRMIYRDSFAYGGSDNVVPKSAGIYKIQNIDAWTMSNYCESTNITKLAQVSGTVTAGGTTTSFLLAAADANQPAGYSYQGRKVTFSGGACGVAGAQAWITADDHVATLGYSPATASAPDPNCTYTIPAVGNYDTTNATVTSPCRDIDWSFLRDGQYFKLTDLQFGAGINPTPDTATIEVNGFRGQIDVNDWGNDPNGGCGAAGSHVTNFLIGYLIGMHGQLAQLNDISGVTNIRVDMPDSPTCTTGIAGISSTGSSVMEDGIYVHGASFVIRDTGDPDANLQGIVANSTGTATTLNISNAKVDITATGGGAGATIKHMSMASNGVIARCDVSSPQELTYTGNPTILSGCSATGKATLDFANAAAGACSADLTIAVPGAADGDSCAVGVVNASVPAAGSQFACWVSAANTVTVRHCCNGAGACDPASGTFRATVTRQ